MKLELTGQIEAIKKINQMTNTMRQPLGKSEILICQAIEKQGDAILFKNNDGSFFMAKMQADIVINVGDTVEMVISDIADAKIMVTVSDVVSREGPQTFLGLGLDEDIERNQNNSSEIGSLVSDISNKPRLLSTVLTMLKKNPQIQPKLALFMAQNNIPASPENIEVLTRIIKGDAQQGTLLFEIMTELQNEENKTEVRQIDENTALENKETQHKQGFLSESLPKNSKSIIQSTSIVSGGEKTQIASENIGKYHSLPESKEEPQRLPEKKEVYIGADRALYEGEENKVHPFDISAGKMIFKKVFSMLYKLDSENKGAQIKKNVLESPEKLKELKILLNHNDIKGKESYMKKAEQIEQQVRIMSHCKRVICFQIPIHINDNTASTAELFVYKYKKSKKNSDTDSLSILIGLDTENIGRVETIIKAENEKISLNICAENEGILDVFNKSEGSLKKAIETTGHTLTGITTHILKEKTVLTNAEEILTREVGNTYEKFDVRV